jgi:CDP-6-deoxy-D-xylo-4-hexulose-3-dehydrase
VEAVIVPASGSVLTRGDKDAMLAAVEKGWLTAGPINGEFEAALGKFTGMRNVRTCNSGSSANLLAVAAMVESGRWKRGDHILTVAASFPTTVNPLMLYGLVPRFVDVELGTYNVNVGHLHRAAASHQVKGIMLAHTLGNPFDVAAVQEIARWNKLSLIGDCCDALGAEVDGKSVFQFGDISTCSFFPAHHITTGEGGAVFTNDDELASLVTSLRDWGRDCWCEPGRNGTCGKRYEWKASDWPGCSLPDGYDHKGICRTLGFNLKGTEIGAACGLSQMGRIGSIVSRRKENFAKLLRELDSLSGSAVLPTYGAGASPFGFPITLRDGNRREMQKWLTQEGVDSRTLFSGNLTRHPYMVGRDWLAHSTMEVTDKIMNDTFWVGCHPELSEEQLDYSAQKIGEFLGNF